LLQLAKKIKLNNCAVCSLDPSEMFLPGILGMADNFLPMTGHALNSTQDRLNRFDPRQVKPHLAQDLIQGKSDHRLNQKQVIPQI